MSDAIIAATYADFKIVKTRGCVQLIFEAPLEQAEQITSVMGWPLPGKERWFGIAPLAVETEAAPKKESEGEVARTRAAILCEDERFRSWIGSAPTAEHAAIWLRNQIGADGTPTSRRKIATDPEVLKNFLEVEARYREETGLQARRK